MKTPKYAIGAKVVFVLVPGRHSPLINTKRLGITEISYFEGRVGGVRVNRVDEFDCEVFNSLYSGWLEQDYVFKTEKEALKFIEAFHGYCFTEETSPQSKTANLNLKPGHYVPSNLSFAYRIGSLVNHLHYANATSYADPATSSIGVVVGHITAYATDLLDLTQEEDSFFDDWETNNKQPCYIVDFALTNNGAKSDLRMIKEDCLRACTYEETLLITKT